MTVDTLACSAYTGMLRSAAADYATARSGGALTLLRVIGEGLYGSYVGQRLTSGTYYCESTYLTFDTSVIPSGDTIDAATLKLYVYSDLTSGSDFTIEARAASFGPALGTDDWVAGADIGAHTLLASLDSATIAGVAGLYSMTSEAALLAAIDTSGYTDVILSSDRFRMGSAPSGDEYVKVYVKAGYAGICSLEVTHTTPSGVTVRTSLPAIVPQLPDVDTCIEYAFDGSADEVKETSVVTLTPGGTYFVAPYVMAYNAAGASCLVEAVVYDGAAEQRTVLCGTFAADAAWDRYPARIALTGGEDGVALRLTFSGSGTITLDLTAVHIVEEDALTAYFATTRYDSGIYGDHADAAPGLPNELCADYGAWLRYGPRRLYDGWQLAPQLTYSDDERWYCPSESWLARGNRSEVFARLYKDSDIAQWQSMENVPSWATMRNSGDKLRILNTAGNPVPAADNGVVYPIAFYWLLGGLRTDVHIDSVALTLTKVGTPLFTLGVCTWAVPPTPTAASTSEATYTSATADGAKTVTVSHAVSEKQAVGLYVKSTNAAGWTATVDNGYDVSAISVTMGTAAGGTFTVDLGVAMADVAQLMGIAADHALHTYSDTGISTLGVRPSATPSGAQDQMTTQTAKQLRWGYEAGGWFDTVEAVAPDPAAKQDRVRWWSLSSADCSFTSDVVTEGEGFYDYCTVTYAAIGVAGVTDGTLRTVTRGRGGVTATPGVGDRVKDLSYSGRYMTEAEATAVADQFMLWQGQTTGARGQIRIMGDVRDVDGHVLPALFMRPGDWVEERDRRGHVPWLVTGVSYEATGRVTVSVGGMERVFPVVSPGVGGLYVDEALNTWEPEAAADAAAAWTPTQDDPYYYWTHPWMSPSGGMGTYFDPRLANAVDPNASATPPDWMTAPDPALNPGYRP